MKVYFFRSWCLTIRKGAVNPLPKNAVIIARSFHLLSTGKGIFCKTERNIVIKRKKKVKEPFSDPGYINGTSESVYSIIDHLILIGHHHLYQLMPIKVHI